MIRKTAVLLACLFLSVTAGGSELGITPSCLVRAEEVEFKLFSAAPGWKGAALQNEQNATFPGEGGVRNPDGSITRQGTFATRYYGDFRLVETRRIEPERADVNLELSASGGVESQLLAVVAEFTEYVPFTVNGREHSFPVIPKDTGWQITVPAGENRLEIPLKRGILHIRGHFGAMVQDNRRFNRRSITLRLLFTPASGKITQAKLAFELKYAPYASTPVRLAPESREEVLGGIRFAIPAGPRQGEFRPEKNAGMRNFYLLGGPDAGTATVRYADGTEERLSFPAEAIPVRESLAVTAFPLAGKPVATIAIGTPVHGLSLSRERITPSQEEREFITAADEAWRPFDFRQEIVPGSALDFSFLLDAPAGKHGFLKVAGDHFEFENRPGRPVRFWGTNLTGRALFQEDARLDRLVEYLAACGYNLLRFHHFDQPLTESMADSSMPDPEKMDRLHYLLAACKKRGIYVTIDLYMSRRLRKGEVTAFPDKEIAARDFKALAMIDADVMRNLEQYSLRLLTSVNPYTGLAWKDDPTLVSVSLINEGTLVNNIKSGFVREAYEKAFRESAAGREMEITRENRNLLYGEFLHELHRRGYGQLASRLRAAGIRVPFSDLNYIFDVSVAFDRRRLDYVDLHSYWAHPDGHELPKTANPASSLTAFGMLGDLAAVRHLDKPFAVTEWSQVFPNGFRSEGGFLAGAYAALQDYDMLCRFNYASNPDRSLRHTPIVGFEQANDPVSLLSDRAGALFFLRGDISEAKKTFAFPVDGELEKRTNALPGDFRILGLIGKTGCIFDRNSLPAGHEYLKSFRKDGEISSAEYDEKNGRIQSSTGELLFDTRRQTFRALSPRSEAFISPAGVRQKGNFASVSVEETFASILISSLDGAPLPESKRIVLMHLTDCLNSGMRFSSQARHTLEAPGRLPLLLRKGGVEVRLKLSGGTLYALDLSGKRIRQIPVRQESGELVFHLDNTSGAFAYELHHTVGIRESASPLP